MPSTMEGWLNHLLQSVEQVANRMEDGISVIMTGKLSSSEVPTNDPLDIDDNTLLDMDESMMGSPLEGIANEVMKDIISNQVKPETIWEQIDAFRSAIHWNEPFIISLLAFQIFMFLICLYVSQRGRGVAIRICVLLCIGALTRSAEFLNGIAARHWQSFATQNYFDRSGIFIGIFFCGPLLLNCFIMLTLMIREASSLLIEVKTMELKKKMSGTKKESVDKSRGKKSKSSHNKQD